MSKLNVNAISPQSGSTIRLTSNLNINGHVTASGNISASGTVFADNFQSTGGDSAGISFTDDFVLTGNMTASGDISGSSTSTGSFGRVEVPKQTGGGPITLGGGAYQDVIIGDGTGTSDIVLDGNSEATLRYKVGGNEKWFLMARSSNNFIFRRNSADRITIDTNGNLAIGFNLVPTERLHVGGNIFATGNISGSSTSTGSFGAVTIDGSPNIHGSNTGANYTGGNTGGWGFGTTEIDGAGITLTPDGTKSSTALVNNSGLGITHAGSNGSYSSLQINTGAGKVLWVGNDAKIGIKNSDPVTELDVRGTISGSNIEAATKITTLGKVAIGTATLPYNGLLVSDPGGASSTSLGNVSGVGITTSGTNTGYYALQVNTGTGALLRVNNGGIVDFPSATKISGSSTSTGSFGVLELNTAGNLRGVVSFTHGNLSNTVIGYAGTGQNLDPSGGRQNTLIGYTVGSQITTGDQNVAIGQENLSGGNSTGNTAVGYRALKGVTTGVGNVGIGRNAADALQSGNFNIGIGQGADLGSTTAANRIVIGHDAAATADNQTVIGNTSQTHVVFGGDALISGSAQSTGSFGRIESSGDMGIDGNIDVKGNVTAQNFIVSSSVTNITYQSLSGSTIFGDTSDDTHQFTGSLTVTSPLLTIDSVGNISGSSTSTGSFGTVESTTAKIPTLLGDVSIGGQVTLLADEIQGSYNPNRLRFPGTQQAEINDVFRINSSSGKGTLGLYGNSSRNSTTLFNFNFNSVTNKFTSDHASVTYKNFYINADAIIGFPGSSGPSQAQDISIFKSNIVTEADHGPGRRLFLDFRHDDVDMFTADMSGSLYAFGNISGSASSTGSFGTINVDFWNKGIGDQTNTYIGHEVGDNLTALNSSPKNTYIGSGAGKNATFKNSRFNTVIGALALDSAVSASSNVIIGSSAAGAWDTTSDNNSNVVIGSDAMPYNAGGIRNIAIGAQVMTYGSAVKTGNDNIAMGQYVLGKATSATGNIGIGQGAILDNIDGNYNVAIGRSSLPNIVSTDYNVAIGERALYALSGSNSHNNVAVGKYAGYHIANGSTSHYGGINSIFIGTDTKALADNETNQIVIGYDAIGKGSNTVVLGDDNITDIYMSEDVGAKLHTGDVSGSSTSTGSFGHIRMDGKDLPPIFVTGSSIYLGGEGTGTGDDGSDNNNVGIGDDVLSGIGTGARNVAIGLKAMENRVAANENVAIGYRAGGPGAQKMGQNTLVGVDAGYSLDGSGGTYNATSNTYIGHKAGDGATEGLKNTAIGDNSARSLVAGSSNVFLGYFSGNGGNTSGGTYIGENTAATDGASNEIVIGKLAVGKGSNTVVLGDDNITDIYMSEDVGATLHTGTVSGSAISTGSFGAVQSAGDITPKVDDTSNLGSAALRFSNVFTTDLQLSNEGKPEGNEVDGTTGSWTIQEGEDDLYLLNRKNGKKYKFKLEEIG